LSVGPNAMNRESRIVRLRNDSDLPVTLSGYVEVCQGCETAGWFS
jgi:hypothetical protein